MMGLGIINLAESATLAGGNWLAGLPVTNVATRDYAEVARSTNDSAASTVISLDHGSAKTARVVCIGWHNLSAAATITWTRGTTAGGSDVYAGGAVNAWQIAPGAFDGRQYAAWVVADATSAQHDTISISDEAACRPQPGAIQRMTGDWRASPYPQTISTKPTSDTSE